jgi:hypothetical protein
LPETEACVQQPGTVRGADGSRLKQKPVSFRFSGITSLRTRCCGRHIHRELLGLYEASKALPETEACAQQLGTVRGADGLRLKQKPVSFRFSGITSLRTRFCGSKRARLAYPPWIRNRNHPARFNPQQDQKRRWRYQPEACWIFLQPVGSHSTLSQSSSPLDGARAPPLYNLVCGMVLSWCRGEELTLSRVCLDCCFVFTFCLLLCLVRRLVASWIVCYLTLLSVACLVVCGLPLLFDTCLYCLFLAICLYCLLLAICLYCLLFAFAARHRNVYFTVPMLKASPTPTHYLCRKSTSLRPSSQPVHAIHVPRRRTTGQEYDYVSLQGTTSDSPEMLLLQLKQRDCCKQQYDDSKWQPLAR